MALAGLLKEVGFPAGVFNIVAGAGSVGAAMTDHPGVHKISFTGSVPTGKKVRTSPVNISRDVEEFTVYVLLVSRS